MRTRRTMDECRQLSGLEPSAYGMNSHLASEQEGAIDRMWTICVIDRNQGSFLIHQEERWSHSLRFIHLHHVGIEVNEHESTSFETSQYVSR